MENKYKISLTIIFLLFNENFQKNKVQKFQ